jgi:hypothetical protein
VRIVRIATPTWPGATAVSAEGFWDRFWGVNRVEQGMGVLLRTRAIQTIGLTSDLEIIALDSYGIVNAIKTVSPNRFAYFGGAEFVVELPGGTAVPPVGSQVTLFYE